MTHTSSAQQQGQALLRIGDLRESEEHHTLHGPSTHLVWAQLGRGLHAPVLPHNDGMASMRELSHTSRSRWSKARARHDDHSCSPNREGRCAAHTGTTRKVLFEFSLVNGNGIPLQIEARHLAPCCRSRAQRLLPASFPPVPPSARLTCRVGCRCRRVRTPPSACRQTTAGCQAQRARCVRVASAGTRSHRPVARCRWI